MTMHKAKGLTAKAVIVMSAEDEPIPGNEVGGLRLEDERRLLYVSLSRAEPHTAVHLSKLEFITLYFWMYSSKFYNRHGKLKLRYHTF